MVLVSFFTVPQGGVTTVRPNQLRQAGEAQAVITTMVEAVDGNWSPSAARANKPKVARPGQAVLDPAAAAAAVAASSGGWCGCGAVGSEGLGDRLCWTQRVDAR